jgi:hypothetical protein
VAFTKVLTMLSTFSLSLHEAQKSCLDNMNFKVIDDIFYYLQLKSMRETMFFGRCDLN